MTTQIFAGSRGQGIFAGARGDIREHTCDYEFPVEEHQVHTDTGLVVPGMRAIVRGDTNDVLGTVKSNYKLLTHADALNPILDSLESKGIDTFKRITTTDNGAKLFANIYFPNEEKTLRNDDSFWPGITIINSLNGTLRYVGEANIYRLACTNGMRVPEKIAGFSLVHSKNKNYDELTEKILEIVADKTKFHTFQTWAETVMSPMSMKDLADKIIDSDVSKFPARYRDLVHEEIDKETSFGVNSVWGLYNSFNSVFEHHLIRENGRYDRARDLDGNMFSMFKKTFENNMVG